MAGCVAWGVGIGSVRGPASGGSRFGGGRCGGNVAAGVRGAASASGAVRCASGAGAGTVLAVDVGGTNGRFQLWGPGDALVAEEVVPTSAHAGFGDALGAFLAGSSRSSVVGAACVAVAGPVQDGRCVMTNCAWAVDAAEVARALGVDAAKVAVINDFEAVGHGLPALGPSDLVTVHAGAGGAGGEGPKVCLGPGTGLGVCVVTRPGVVTAGEGGHAGFAPRGDAQRALHAWVEGREGFVELEALVCGPGLARIHAFMQEREGSAAMAALPIWQSAAEREASEAAKAAAAAPVGAEEVTRRAAGGDPVAVRSVEMLLAVLGAEAGHLALRLRATGGVYIAGGVTPKLAAWWRDLPQGAPNPLLDAYLWPQQAQAFRALLAACPLHVVVNEDVGLLGSRAVARAILADNDA